MSIGNKPIVSELLFEIDNCMKELQKHLNDDDKEQEFDVKAFWNKLDTKQTYSTNADKVYIIGKAKRAIGIDLTDTKPELPSPVGKIDNHMTIFYNSSSKQSFTNKDIQIIDKTILKWKKQNKIESVVSYEIEPGHGRSANINGDLCDLCKYIRKECQNVCKDDQVPPHVGLLTRNYR